LLANVETLQEALEEIIDLYSEVNVKFFLKISSGGIGS